MVEEGERVGKKSYHLKEEGCLAMDGPETAAIGGLRMRKSKREGEWMDLRQQPLDG
jgi:hypothetical protein